MNLSFLQQKIDTWVEHVFTNGEGKDRKERGLRLAEEAIEFCQAVEVDPEKLKRLIDYVYSRPTGQPDMEIGGVMVTLLAAASSVGVDVAQVTRSELRRINTSKVIARIRQRQKEKREL